MRRSVVIGFVLFLVLVFWIFFVGKYSNEYGRAVGCNRSMGEIEEGYCLGFVVDLDEAVNVSDEECLVVYKGSECDGFRFFVKLKRWGTFDNYIRAGFAALAENISIK